MWEELDGPLDEYLWYHIRGVQGKTGGKNLEKRLEKADQAAQFAQFQVRQASVQTILDMKKLAAFAFLRQEMQDTADCLNMGFYTMGDQEFKELYESRKRYFESADLACRVIQEQTEQVKKEQGYAWSSSQMQAGLLAIVTSF